jgi:hypothetical protein
MVSNGLPNQWIVGRRFRGDIHMRRILDSVSYPVLIFIAAFMLLAPFSPMPHVVEKLIMLKNGNLTRAVDIFDLCFHLAPTVLLAIKFFRTR